MTKRHRLLAFYYWASTWYQWVKYSTQCPLPLVYYSLSVSVCVCVFDFSLLLVMWYFDALVRLSGVQKYTYSSAAENRDISLPICVLFYFQFFMVKNLVLLVLLSTLISLPHFWIRNVPWFYCSTSKQEAIGGKRPYSPPRMMQSEYGSKCSDSRRVVEVSYVGVASEGVKACSFLQFYEIWLKQPLCVLLSGRSRLTLCFSALNLSH